MSGKKNITINAECIASNSIFIKSNFSLKLDFLKSNFKTRTFCYLFWAKETNAHFGQLNQL